MRFSQRLHMIAKNLRQSPGRTALACMGVGVGMMIFLAAAALGVGVQTNVLSRLKQAMPERILVAQPAGGVNLGPLKLGTKLITEDQAERLRAMKEVEKVWPQIPVRFPIQAEASLMGFGIVSDIVVNGVAPELVAADVAPGRDFRFNPDLAKPAPAIIPRLFIDIYNISYSEANGLPKLSESAVMGLQFTLIANQSNIAGLGRPGESFSLPCRIVGLTDNPTLLGIVLPDEYVTELNRRFAGTAGPAYNGLHIQLRSIEDFDVVLKAIEGMGLRLESKQELLRRLQFFLRIVLLIVMLFGALVLFVAFSNVVNTFSLILLQRRFEIGLLRALGAPRRMVAGLFAGEAAILGALGGAFGSLAAWGLVAVANAISGRYLPNLTLLPENQRILEFGWGLALLGVLFPAFISMAATLPMALRATARQPARLLRED